MSDSHEQRTQELLRAWGNGAVPLQPRSGHERERGIATVQAAMDLERARSQRQRVWSRWAALGAAAVLVASLGFGSFRWGLNLGERSVVAQQVSQLAIGESTGGVVLQRSGEPGVVQVGPSSTLSSGDTLETLVDGQADLTTDHSKYRVARSTRLELLGAERMGERLRLSHGKVEVEVSPAKERSVVVVTPHAEVLVVGTAFSVQVSGEASASATSVTVEHGTVWVMQRGQRSAVLHAGQSWSSEREAPRLAASAPSEASPRLAPPSASSAAASAGTLAEENRLFRAALDARNRGDNGGAAELFAELLRRFPRSVVREEASLGRLRALQRAGRHTEAAVEARRYLARFPSGHAREEAERVLSGTIP